MYPINNTTTKHSHSWLTSNSIVSRDETLPVLDDTSAIKRSETRPDNGGNDLLDDTGGHLIEVVVVGCCSPIASAIAAGDFFFLCFFNTITLLSLLFTNNDDDEGAPKSDFSAVSCNCLFLDCCCW